ncbi:MAG TPA: MFS transporter [Steroidobacteraceae bacterium]|nr:MFS transporter [Steroidobacteraceae bacterium]
MDDNNRIVDVGEVIDSAHYFWVPFGITVMMVIIMLTDGLGLFTTGYIGPQIVRDWHIGRDQLSWIGYTQMGGMAIGSVLLGWVSDHIGRKKAYFSCLALLFVGSLLCYSAANIPLLAGWRFITGLGLGGITPLATTLISEWTPKRVRSLVVACVIVSVPLGGSLAGILAAWLIPAYGWRSMFLVGAIIPLALLLLFWLLLPESPKYLALRPALHPQLARALNRLLGAQRFNGTERFVVVEHAKASGNWLATIWNSRYWRSTLYIWIAFTFNTLVLYIFSNSLPVLLDFAHQSTAVASRSLSLFSGGGVVGSIGGAALMGLWGSRGVGTVAAFIGAVATAAIGVLLVGGSNSEAALLVCCFIGGAVINGMQSYLYAVSAHSYPTEIRGAAIGVAQAFSRFGGLLSATVPQVYFRMTPVPTIDRFFWFVAGCALVTTISYFLIPSHISRTTQGGGAIALPAGAAAE